jgi:pyruvate,water dikinase
MEWEFDGQASSTFPFYSRAVVGDLCPEPVTPLTATAGVGAELGPAWSHVYADLGLMRDPFPAPEADPGGHAVAVFGAQLYLNTSLLRLFGATAAGADPHAWVRQYLGNGPAVPRQRTEPDLPDTAPEQLRHWTEQALGPDAGGPDPAELDHLVRRVGQLRAGRPDPAGSTGPELAARITAARGELRRALRLHARAELATALTTELLTRTAEEAGHPTRSGDLIAGLGGGFRAEPMATLWRMSRQVRDSDRLRRLFDQGVPHAAGQLANAGHNNEVGRLRTALAPLLAEHGHHGPGGWEIGGQVWAGEPRLLLTLLNTLRHCPDDLEPAVRAARRVEAGAEAVAAVRGSLAGAPDASTRFESALAAAPRWLRARRRLVELVSAVVHEQRLAARELGRRQVEAGRLDGVDQVFMLLAGELEEFARQPEPLAEALRMRAYDYYALGTYRPPFITLGQPPPAVRWPRLVGTPGAAGPNGAASPNGAAGSNGSTGAGGLTRRGITGTGAAPGVVTGPARVSRSPGAAAGLRPGEVLVVPSAGLEWLPLLPGAAAVVVDAGGPLSEVAAAARDLGLPCVVGCEDATQRMVAGQEVVVDGWLGTVRPEQTRADEPPADASLHMDEVT